MLRHIEIAIFLPILVITLYTDNIVTARSLRFRSLKLQREDLADAEAALMSTRETAQMTGVY